MTGIDLDSINNLSQVERDRWGRYLVARDGKKVPYTRVTTFVKAVDDTFNLQQWQQRMVAIGLSRRPALQAMVAAADPADKKKLNDLCEQARTAAGADDNREIGTALHTFVERLNRGQDVPVPAQWAPDLGAYKQALAEHGIEVIPELCEQTVVNDRWKVAGTADMVVRWNGETLIGDLKTGASIAWSLGAYSAQLACYATAAHLYDHQKKELLPMPEVSQHHGLLVHLPSGTGKCEVHLVDLRAGADLADLCAQVREARKRKDWMRRLPTANPASTPAAGEDVMALTAGESAVANTPALQEPTVAELRLWTQGRIDDLREHDGAIRALAQAWPAGVPTLKRSDQHTVEQLDQIALVLDCVEARHGNPLSPPRPRSVATRAGREWWSRQLTGLPADLRSEVNNQVTAAGIDMTASLLYAADLVAAKQYLGAAEEQLAARLAHIDTRAAIIDPDRVHGTVVARACSCNKVTDLDLLEHRHLLQIDGLASMTKAGLVEIGPDETGEHVLRFDLNATAAALVEACGNKTQAVAAGKTLAARLGGLRPTTFAQLTDSPSLIAGIYQQHLNLKKEQAA